MLEQRARRRGTAPDALADELRRSDLAAAVPGGLDAALAGLAEFVPSSPRSTGRLWRAKHASNSSNAVLERRDG